MRPSVFLCLFASALLHCSSQPSAPDTSDAASQADARASASDSGTGKIDATPELDSGATLPEGAADSSSQAPVAATLKSVEKLGGGLHVTWTLGEAGLSSVELWRKQDSAAYAKRVGLPGTATSYHDASLPNGSSSYCYKLKETRAVMDSEFSNEICGVP